jgi:hypothetical protein
MATIVTHTPSQSHSPQHSGSALREIVEFFRQFIVQAFHPYRPELHYMRGPGPACKAKQDSIAHRHLI